MIFAGKITQKKGVKSLLRALNLLDYEKEKIQLILAGGAGNIVEYEEIKELADGCRYPVVFAGCVTQSRLAELYNDCDIFVLPSMYEGLPLTVIESLACGDRVVMTKLEGIAEWLADMVPDADIRYVLPPGMKGTDEPLEEELPEFESRLAEALREAIEEKDTKECDVSRISWQKIAPELTIPSISVSSSSKSRMPTLFPYYGIIKSGKMIDFIFPHFLCCTFYSVSFLLTYPGRSLEDVSSFTCVILACLSTT